MTDKKNPELWQRYDTWLVDNHGLRNIGPGPWATDGLSGRYVELFPAVELDLGQQTNAARSIDRSTD